MTPDVSQLPSLIRLLEDDSDLVRTEVTAALQQYGDQLNWLVDTLDPPVTDLDRTRLETIVLPGPGWLKHRWAALEDTPLTWDSLELRLGLLSRYIRGHGSVDDVTTSLDDITLDFQDSGPHKDVFDLGKFFYFYLGLAGNRHEYYDPENCDLYSVMMNGVGTSLSLSLVFLLASYRMRFHTEGCNHPSGFMVKAWHDDRLYLVDAFNYWTFFSERDIAGMDPDHSERLLASASTPCDLRDMLALFLENLASSYRFTNQPDRAALIESLPLPATAPA